ncbi:MAG: PadR family transcriptional regulator [Gaiellaceae bacterium]
MSELHGHLDVLTLAVLAEAPAHGYAIIEELRRRSAGAFDLPEGTVYPALHRLEASGFLTSSWKAHGGRRRRVYRLTRSGRGRLERGRSEWSAFSGAVTAVVGEAQ